MWFLSGGRAAAAGRGVGEESADFGGERRKFDEEAGAGLEVPIAHVAGEVFCAFHEHGLEVAALRGPPERVSGSSILSTIM